MIINFNLAEGDDIDDVDDIDDTNLADDDDDEQSINPDDGELILGSIGDDILVSLDGNDTLDGQEGDDILSGVDGNNSLIGGEGNDTLNGGGSGFRDDMIFITANASGIDTLTGGLGEDLFILGGNSDPELGDNSVPIVHYNEAGNDDYAVIADLEPTEDVIMLGALKDEYNLVNSTVSSNLYFGDELIAIIQGDADLSLDESYFQFQDTSI